MELKETCELRPVTDDMALCHPSLQTEGSKRLTIFDAEYGWFIRTDHIQCYGTDSYLEKLTIHPPEPLIFLNYETSPDSTCLIWEHVKDSPTKRCPNPRVVVPRQLIPKIVDEPVQVDVRSFGIRTPPTTRENPSYGILGMFHILPPSLAWLWRLVSPRGYANPSVVDTDEMGSEGVGSYWPFATGTKCEQANLLLNQMLQASDTRYILVPNQHIGCYKVGFMPQWIAREYLARRGTARFNTDQIIPSRCSILGYQLTHLKVDGTFIPKELLHVYRQPEVGLDGYDKGSEILTAFFKKQLKEFLDDENLLPLGRKIIEAALRDCTLEEYLELIPMKL
jgi:Domain of unknown function (DUF4914)